MTISILQFRAVELGLSKLQWNWTVTACANPYALIAEYGQLIAQFGFGSVLLQLWAWYFPDQNGSFLLVIWIWHRSCNCNASCIRGFIPSPGKVSAAVSKDAKYNPIALSSKEAWIVNSVCQIWWADWGEIILSDVVIKSCAFHYIVNFPICCQQLPVLPFSSDTRSASLGGSLLRYSFQASCFCKPYWLCWDYN